MYARLLLLPFVFAGLTLGGCATPEQFPSLAVRDAERVSGTIAVPEGPSYTPAPPTQATIEQLDSLAAHARAAHTRFVDATSDARAPISASRGTQVGSDAWSVAQVELAGLEAIRSDAMIALADIDRIFVDSALQGAEISRIESIRDEIAALLDEENRVIGAFLAEIGS